jgi:hypothetical protein
MMNDAFYSTTYRDFATNYTNLVKIRVIRGEIAGILVFPLPLSIKNKKNNAKYPIKQRC